MKITVKQLRSLVESAVREASRSKGEWSGLGTDTPIWHGHEPKKRAPKLVDPRSPRIAPERYVQRAREIWNAASAEARERFTVECGWSRVVSPDDLAATDFDGLEALIVKDHGYHVFQYYKLLVQITDPRINQTLKR